MKKTAIFNVGGWGAVSRKSYNETAELLSYYLTRMGASVQIFTSITPEAITDYDTLIFQTRGVIKEAREIKAKNPTKTVILLTGLVQKGDENGGIIVIDKGETDIDEILLSYLQ